MRLICALAGLVVVAGCANAPPADSSAPPRVVLDGTYVATEGSKTEQFTFSNADGRYSVSITGETPFSEEGTYTFDDGVLRLTSSAGARTKLDVNVLEATPLTRPSALRPQGDLYQIAGQALVGDPTAVSGSFSFRQCGLDLEVTYTNGAGQVCKLLIPGATLLNNPR
jgi:hypothetical protein